MWETSRYAQGRILPPAGKVPRAAMWRLLKVKVSDKVANAFLTSTSGSALSA
jgi:hypothetical protein